MNLQLSESAGEAVKWSWKGPNGFVSVLQNPLIPLPTAAASGTYNVTVTGANGLTASSNITVQIFPLPTANAGADIGACKGGAVTLSGNGGVSCRWEPSAGLNNANSCNPVANVSQSGYFTLTVTDLNGCTATDRVDVFVHKPSNLVCNDQMNVSLGQNGTLQVLADQVLEGTYPFYGFFSVEIEDIQGKKLGNTVTCADIGKKLTYTVTDRCEGNQCWGNLKVEDKLAPKITCTDLTVPCALPDASPEYLKNFLGITTAYPKVEENCVNHTLTYSETWTDLACEDKYNGISGLSGYFSRTWITVDGYKNYDSCHQRVFLRRLAIGDLVLPPDTVISCQQPQTDPSATGAPYFSFLGKNFTLYPNPSYCELNVVFQDQALPICPGSYKIVRKWTLMDWCKPVTPSAPFTNPTFHTQIVKVSDNNKPVINCPPNTTVAAEPFTCCALVDLPDAIMEDACSGLEKIWTDIELHDYYTGEAIGEQRYIGSLRNFPQNNLWHPDTMGVFGFTSCIQPGTHVVSYFAQDGCGNTVSCSFSLAVEDQTPPVVACDKTTQVAIGADGEDDVFASTFDDGSFDNCCAIQLEARRMNGRCDGSPDDFGPLVGFCCTDIGKTILVVLRVVDCNGNENECMVEVEVVDKIKPTCVPPADRTISCEIFDPSLWSFGVADAADNCCLDTLIATPNYALFDTFCNRGTLVRHFKSIDCYGNQTNCSQRIVVFYESDYYLRLPNDVVTKICNGKANFGVPSFFNTDCEKMGYSFEDEVFTVVPGACFKIERTWKIMNWCAYDPLKPCTLIPNPEPSPNPLDPNNIRGPVIGPPGLNGQWTPTVVKVNPSDTVPTNYGDLWDPNTNCYIYKQVIKIVDSQDPTISNCPSSDVQICDLTGNDPQLWNDALWTDPVTQSHNLCEGPTDLSITATDLCSKAIVSFRYLLALDLDGDGDMETIVNSNDPAPAGQIRFDNANTPNLQGGELRNFDQRPVIANQKYQFAVQTTTSGNNVSASMRWNTPVAPNTYTVPELPYGTHKIKWIVEDGCGNERICEYNFVVKDCKAPTVVCHNGLSTNIMQTGMITLWAADFLLYGDDNCTPANRLVYSIRKAGKGSGFPLDANGDPVTNVTFDCTELGNQPVELWARDLAGNVGYCETYILVQDINHACATNDILVAGSVIMENGQALEEANVEVVSQLSGQAAWVNIPLTGADGVYEVEKASTAGANLSITPFKDNNPLNGVSTYDLVLISKHILGLAPLESPLKMIAADANRSNSITTLDIVELRKLILGIYTELPNNSSWRFVPQGHVFANPNNPFEQPIPESIEYKGVMTDALGQDFYAIKVGDVNTSAVANSMNIAKDRNARKLWVDADERDIHNGETFDFPVKMPNGLAGFQFTLETEGLEIMAVKPGAGLVQEQFALLNPQTLTMAHHEATEATFILRLHATRSGRLSDMMRLTHRVTASEAYSLWSANRVGEELSFRFVQKDNAGKNIQLYQNQPNPFEAQTIVSFHLPYASKASFTVFDEAGRTIFTSTADYPAGNHAITLKDTDLKQKKGVFFYRLQTDNESLVRKMIKG